jgi:DeoR/GlpR family transcriptional regulator of sugar metabolism
MTKRNELFQTVAKFPQRTSKEYATLMGRPHPSVRRDLDELAKNGLVRRVRDWDGDMAWDRTWEAA